MVEEVGEMASMKRRKLWKTGKEGLCCFSSAIQNRLGPSSLLEQSEIPMVFVVFLCCRLPPKLGETAKVYRYRFSYLANAFLISTDMNTFSIKQILMEIIFIPSSTIFFLFICLFIFFFFHTISFHALKLGKSSLPQTGSQSESF